MVRHPCNIGGPANVLRCFELARGHWLWVLGDDEEPEPDAVARLLGDIEVHKEAVFLNYFSELCGSANRASGFPKRMNGLSELVAECDSFSNLLFISSGVYNHAMVPGAMRHAQLFTGSFAPHLALLMVHLRRQGGVSVMLSQRLVKHHLPAPADHWDGSHIFPRIAELLSLVPELSMRRCLGRLMLAEDRPRYPFRGYLSFVISGRTEELSLLLSDQVILEREHALARGRPGIRSLLRLTAATLLLLLQAPLRSLLRPVLSHTQGPPGPCRDLASRTLDDRRV